MKTCGKCGAQHEPKGYHHGNTCYGCTKAYYDEYRKQHPEIYSKAHRKHILKTKYGLTEEDYAALLESQNGGCAVCGTTVPWSRSNVFHVDHNHETGQVRGLLCSHCNIALGNAKDDPILLRALADYLER